MSQGSPPFLFPLADFLCSYLTILCSLIPHTWLWSLSFIKIIHVYKCFVCMNACALCTRLVLSEVRRQHQIHWDWSYRWLEPTCRCRGLILGPLQEQLLLNSAFIFNPSHPQQHLYLLFLAVPSYGWGAHRGLLCRSSCHRTSVCFNWTGCVQHMSQTTVT